MELRIVDLVRAHSTPKSSLGHILVTMQIEEASQPFLLFH